MQSGFCRNSSLIKRVDMRVPDSKYRESFPVPHLPVPVSRPEPRLELTKVLDVMGSKLRTVQLFLLFAQLCRGSTRENIIHSVL